MKKKNSNRLNWGLLLVVIIVISYFYSKEISVQKEIQSDAGDPLSNEQGEMADQNAYLIARADYPQLSKFPDYDEEDFDSRYERWRKDQESLRKNTPGYDRE